MGRLEVQAPVSGVVFGLAVFAPGEVVRPGEPILKIVPEDAGLVVIARVDMIDVDQVWPEQEAMLRFSAFPARETPEIAGHVVRVSADAVRDGETGLFWYEVELAMDRPAGSGGEAQPSRSFGSLEVTPGTPVEVLIRTEERSVVS